MVLLHYLPWNIYRKYYINDVILEYSVWHPNLMHHTHYDKNYFGGSLFDKVPILACQWPKVLHHYCMYEYTTPSASSFFFLHQTSSALHRCNSAFDNQQGARLSYSDRVLYQLLNTLYMCTFIFIFGGGCSMYRSGCSCHFFPFLFD